MISTISNEVTDHFGYIVVAFLDEKSQKKIIELQNLLKITFPKIDFIFSKPEESHITILHVITSNSDYDTDTEKLYENDKPKVFKVLNQIIPSRLNISLTFDIVETFPAAIIIKGHDDGTIDKIREKFCQEYSLHPSTRRPPQIIHSTIARFKNETSIDELQEFTQNINLGLNTVVSSFELIQERKLYVQDFRKIKVFPD